jgi:hypothetical protein
MPTITVKPINSISVRVNQGTTQTVSGTTTFVGGTSASAQANAALALAQSAFNAANTKVSKSGDTMTGNLVVMANVNSSLFIGEIDGGTFT